jgi:peptide/nickel transport system substrate-binding protein
MFDQVITFDKDFNIIPQVAEKWEFKDGNWRFSLRKDMKFSDGSPLTADDVAFSVNNIATRNLPQRTYLPTITEAKVVDQYTVDVFSKNPDVTILNGMAWVYVLPKAYYEKVGKDTFQNKPIGSGPYENVEFTPSQFARFKLRSEKHPFRSPIATEMIFQTVPEQSAVASGLRTGDIDLTAHVTFSVDQADALKKDGVGVLTLLASNITALASQLENQQRNTPLADKRVRIALNYAIDRDTIANNLFKGQAIAVSQLSIPSSPFWLPDVKPIPYDPAKAKQLLAEAGYPNGFKLPVGIEYTPSSVNPQLPLALQGYLKDVGVDAPVTSYEIAAFLDKFYGRNGQNKGDLFMTSAGDANGTGSSWRGTYDCDKPGFAVWWCNKEFNQVFDQALAEPDAAKRTALLQKAHRIFLDDVPELWLVVVPLYVAYGAKIQGVEYTTPVVWRYDNAYRVD